MRLTLATLTAGLALTLSSLALAHNGVKHKTPEEAIKHLQESENTPGFPEVKGGDFTLVDHNGNTRTSRNPDGHYQLLFFGYASCKAICSVALPRMASAVDVLAEQDITVTPVLITVDPERDRVETMAKSIRHYHADLVGLTGSEARLAEAYKAFNVEKSVVYVHPEEGPIYAHGSFIYLLAPDGSFKTLLPPILSPERIAEVAAGYITGRDKTN